MKVSLQFTAVFISVTVAATGAVGCGASNAPSSTPANPNQASGTAQDDPNSDLSTASGNPRQAKQGDAPETKAPEPATREILDRTQGYANWSRFYEEPLFSRGHDGMYVVAYYNQVVAAALGEDVKSLPDGSLIVKENRPEPDAAPMALTTIEKQDGEWYWIKHTPDGQVFVDNGVSLEGKNVRGCVGCHAQAQHDSVFALER